MSRYFLFAHIHALGTRTRSRTDNLHAPLSLRRRPAWKRVHAKQQRGGKGGVFDSDFGLSSRTFVTLQLSFVFGEKEKRKRKVGGGHTHTTRRRRGDTLAVGMCASRGLFCKWYILCWVVWFVGGVGWAVAFGLPFFCPLRQALINAFSCAVLGHGCVFYSPPLPPVFTA